MSAARNEGRCGSFAAAYKPAHGGYPTPVQPLRESMDDCIKREGVTLSALENRFYRLYNSGDLSEAEFNVARACIEAAGDV